MENVPIGTEVGTVPATNDSGMISYAITAGNISNAFAISNNGLLTTSNNIDYETISKYSLTIVVTDGSGNTYSSTITVSITDVALAPNVTTLTPSGVQVVDAILRGNLTELGEDSDGSMRASEYGFIYSTNASNQTSLVIGASGVEKTNLGFRNTNGQFSNEITGIEEDTTYYYRAYAGNDVGTNLGEVRSFTTGILHKTFSLNGAIDGEQSGLIYPGGTHTYSVPLSNTHAYNLTVEADSDILSNLAIYEGTNTNELYIKPGPFSIVASDGDVALSNITATFSGADNDNQSRYLVLPLSTTNHRLVISNSNAEIESYTLTLGEEMGTASLPIGRLLIETPMGFFTNNEPELYWVHIPPNKSHFDTAFVGHIPSFANACGISIDMDHTFPTVFNVYINSGTPKNNRYTILRFLNDGYNYPSIDYRGCQYRFRFTNR